MGRIYESARRVVAWLGPPDGPTSGFALAAMMNVGRQFEYSIDHHFFRSPDADQDDWYVLDKKVPCDERTWQAIEHLLERLWFERVWIV